MFSVQNLYHLYTSMPSASKKNMEEETEDEKKAKQHGETRNKCYIPSYWRAGMEGQLKIRSKWIP